MKEHNLKQNNEKIQNFHVVFESENILYVKISELLIDDYLKMVNDLEVQKFISHKIKNFTYHDELNWIKSNLENDNIIFSMIEKVTFNFIGNIEITKNGSNKGELGISITSHMQNKHYGYESIRRIIEYAKDVLRINELELNVYNFNERAIHLYERLGFIKDGIGKTDEDIHMKYIN